MIQLVDENLLRIRIWIFGGGGGWDTRSTQDAKIFDKTQYCFLIQDTQKTKKNNMIKVIYEKHTVRIYLVV